MVRQELAEVMRRAEGGLLDLKRAPGDVGAAEQMRRDDRVLEIKLMDRQDRQGGQWKIRVYYSEPAHVYEQLLLLSIRGKHPGHVGLGEQDGHIDVAGERLDDQYN